MRTKDEELMRELETRIDEFYLAKGRTPTSRELAAQCGISAMSVVRYLREMDDRGMLVYANGNITTNKMLKASTLSVNVPLVGSISCGRPLLAEESIETYYRLPVELLGSGEFFFLRANGDSMVEACINDNDLILVRRTEKAEEGDIVVALVDGETTLKRFFLDKKSKKIILHPENSKMKDIVVRNCDIQGVAVKVLKDL